MFDFVEIVTTPLDDKKTKFEVYPEFIVKRSKDLMIRGKAFYAVWNEDTEMWCTDDDYIAKVVDTEIQKQVLACRREHPDAKVRAKYLKTFSSNKWTEWQKYVKSLSDNYHELDTKIAFANTTVKKTDYISKRLPYDLVDGPCEAYDEMMSVLYAEEERKKLEWAIGAIISGDSIHIQKFMVLYGPPKSGKSTFLHIVEKLFEGYYTTFEAKALGSVNNPFALEAFKNNPLIAIQHDGDLSRIEDNTKINQIVAHEDIVVNEKFKSTYATHFNSFLFLGTNKPVKITDAKSGIIRRLIDVEPTGETIPRGKYDNLKKQIEFELGSIASHCLKVYKSLGESYYDGYKSLKMIGATNDLYNFLEEYRFEIRDKDEVLLSEIWKAYNDYCTDANIPYKMKKGSFKEELKSYFEDYKERTNKSRDVFIGLLNEKFIRNDEVEPDFLPYKLQFNKRVSTFDEWCKDKGFKAQYAKEDGSPEKRWDDVKTTLEDIDSRKLHYVLIPEEENHIFIDFDLKDEKGEKSFERNLEEASKWPATYAELSKSGGGIHLHYFYDGDVNNLEAEYAPGIEIKVSKGKSALRRLLSKCNDVPMATINSGLPLKVERRKEVVDKEQIKDDEHLHNLVWKALRKEGKLNSTTVACNFIYHVVEEEAYKQGVSYDLRDLESKIRAFANNSSHNYIGCTKLMAKVHMCSDDMLNCASGVGSEDGDDKPIAIFDVEVFPNVFILCWKFKGDSTVFRLINPKRDEVKYLFENYRMVGFNNRRYDNHICYAYAYKGYSFYELFILSQGIINVKKGERSTSFFGPAYNMSYFDLY